MLAIFSKELTSTLHSKKTYLSILLAVVILSAITVAVWPAQSERRIITAQIAIHFSILMSTSLLFLTTMIVPIICAPSITLEKEKNTWEMLLTTPIPLWQILLGKIGVPLGYLIWLLLITFPLLYLCVLMGGVSASKIVDTYFIILTALILFAMISLWCSAYFQRTYTALAGAYCIILPALSFLLWVWYDSFDPDPLIPNHWGKISLVVLILLPILYSRVKKTADTEYDSSQSGHILNRFFVLYDTEETITDRTNVVTQSNPVFETIGNDDFQDELKAKLSQTPNSENQNVAEKPPIATPEKPPIATPKKPPIATLESDDPFALESYSILDEIDRQEQAPLNNINIIKVFEDYLQPKLPKNGILPDDVNPIYSKELYYELSSTENLFFRLLLLWSAVLMVAMSICMATGFLKVYLLFSTLTLILVIPAIAGSSFPHESEIFMYEILSTTPISFYTIYWGKAKSLLRMMGMFLSILFMPCLGILGGQLNVIQVFYGMLLLLSSAFFLLFFSLWYTSKETNTMKALMSLYTLIFLVAILPVLVILALSGVPEEANLVLITALSYFAVLSPLLHILPFPSAIQACFPSLITTCFAHILCVISFLSLAAIRDKKIL